MSIMTEERGDMEAQLQRVTAERDAALRVSEAAMRLMTDAQLKELRRVLDEMESPAGE